MKRLFLLLFFFQSVLMNAQFRQLNPMAYLGSENPSFIVSPLDYNKCGLFRQTNGATGVQSQLNFDHIYSALGADLYYNNNAFNAAALQFATHSYTSERNLHVGFGARAEFTNYENHSFNYSFGLNVMSNPAGNFLAGVSYKNADLQVSPFSNEVLVLENAISSQVGLLIFRLTRKNNLGFSGIYKRGFMGEEKVRQYQAGFGFSFRKGMVGVGMRAWDNAHAGAYVRGSYLFKKFVVAYTGIASDKHRSLQQWNHEISLQYKF